MTTTDYAIEKLTLPWSDVLSPNETGLKGYTPIDYPPMLDMLDDACRGNIGERGAGGSDPATRSLLNAEAHTLREQIDGTVRAWIVQLGREKPVKDLKAAINQLAGVLQSHHASGTIPDSEHERIMGFFPRWCERIWRLYDPPKEVPLTGACTNSECEQTHYLNADGDLAPALVAYYHRGSGLINARCRSCGWTWGPDQVRLLGQHLGATQNEEVITAAGF